MVELIRKAFGSMALVCVAAACTSAAAPSPTEPASGVVASPIIRGKGSDTSQDAAVLILHYDPTQAGGGTARCTGVLLAPNLVLTARHCVSITDASAACTEDGTAAAGGRVLGEQKANTFFVFTGPEEPDFISGLGKAPRGEEVLVEDVKTICNQDIALIVLDTKIEGAVIAPLRLDEPPTKNELITAIGWGITEKTDTPEIRQQRAGIKITAVGPEFALGPNEFRTGEGTCSGDSGGPAVAESGAVLGVLSRGGNGTGEGASACIGTESVYSGVAGHAELIRNAYAKVGQDPWIEGQPNPLLGKLGDGCGADGECRSSLCNSGGMCSIDCSAEPCPGGWSCGDSAGRKLCLKDEEDDGCRVSPSRERSSGSASGTLLLAAIVLGVAARGRRRARPH